jgi:hypothetical protein
VPSRGRKVSYDLALRVCTRDFDTDYARCRQYPRTRTGLADRVSFIHQRFGQGAIAGEFVDGRVWVLEANVNPFITYGHDMANSAAKAGMEHTDFIQHLVDAAVARYERA